MSSPDDETVRLTGSSASVDATPKALSYLERCFRGFVLLVGLACTGALIPIAFLIVRAISSVAG